MNFNNDRVGRILDGGKMVVVDYWYLTLTCAKFKVWMTIVESGWNVWVWLVGVVSRKRVWLVEVYGI